MTNVSRTIGIAAWTSLLLLIQLFPLTAHGQVIPSLKPGGDLSTFGGFSYGHSDYAPQAIYGYTIGGFLQTSHILGFETRGSALSFGGTDHQYSALAGIRGSMHFSRFSPYVVGLGGVAHARWQGEIIDGHVGPEANKTGIAPEWSVVGGVDWYVHHHISIRLGEISYSKIYVLQHGLTPMAFSAGVVYRLPFGR